MYFNPYLPAIGRIFEVLRQAGQPGDTIALNNRELAARAGLRSAGHIPGMLRQLERDGYLVRVASKAGTLLELTGKMLLLPESLPEGDPDRDHLTPDCSAETHQGDPTWDHVRAKGDPTWDHLGSQGDPDRDHLDRIPVRDHLGDAPKGDPDRDHRIYKVLSSNMSSSSSTRAAQKSEPTWADVQRTIAEADFVPSRALQKAGHSPGAVLDAWANILTRPEYAPPERVKVFFAALLSNQPIFSAADLAARSEAPNAPAAPPDPDRPARAGRPAAADRRQRPAAGRAPAEPIDAAALAAKFKPPSRDGW